MTDLLTHALAVYVSLVIVVWRTDLLSKKYVPIGMLGAIAPDLAKINHVVPSQIVESTFRVPFSWLPLHRLGGIIAIAIGLTLFFRREIRTRICLLLLYGGGSHLFLDALVKRANGTAPPYFYPLSWWRPPAGNLYLSSDVWPALLAILAAGCVLVIDLRRNG